MDSKTYPRLAGSLLLLTIITLISGCGGPRYAKQFRATLSDALASNYPLELKYINYEEISSTPEGAVFYYHAKAYVSEDLYGIVPAPDRSPAQTAINELIAANVGMDIAQSAAQKQLLLSQTPDLTVLKKVTEKGALVSVDGKERALLNVDGTWSFQNLDQKVSDIEGKPLPEGKYFLEDSKEAKDYFSDVQSKVQDVISASKIALKNFKEAQKSESERAADKAMEAQESFLSQCSPGKAIYGIWQSSDATGEIGIRFGDEVKTASGYSIQGFLFDPANPSSKKPFSGVIHGDGSTQPFVLELAVTGTSGGVYTPQNMYPNDTANTAYTYLLNKTVGFLLDKCNYHFKLVYSTDDGSFTGQITETNPGPFLTGNINDLQFQFNKGYRPKSMAGGNSEVVPNAQQPDASATQPTSSEIQYKFTESQVLKLQQDSKQLAEKVAADAHLGDTNSTISDIEEMAKLYPDAPSTLRFEMFNAFLQNDIPKAKGFYNTLMTQYPDVDNIKEKATQIYQAYMRKYNSTHAQ